MKDKTKPGKLYFFRGAKDRGAQKTGKETRNPGEAKGTHAKLY